MYEPLQEARINWQSPFDHARTRTTQWLYDSSGVSSACQTRIN